MILTSAYFPDRVPHFFDFFMPCIGGKIKVERFVG